MTVDIFFANFIDFSVQFMKYLQNFAKESVNLRKEVVSPKFENIFCKYNFLIILNRKVLINKKKSKMKE